MKALVIARYTFRELIKSKLLWNVVVLGLVIAVMSWVAAEFTFGVPGKVALDVGLSALSLSGYGIAIFVGATLISRELESRTIYMIISRPVAREAFLAGKIMGLAIFLALNFLLLASFSIGSAALMGVSIDSVIWWSLIASYLECLILMLAVICLSLEVNTVLTVMFSILILITGHAVGETLQASYVKSQPLLSMFLNLYHWVMPGFYKFNLKDHIIYQQQVPTGWYLSTLGYGAFYFGFLTFISMWLIKRKELH